MCFTLQIIDHLLDVQAYTKPQYHMASEVPLVLFDCEFLGVDWIYEPGACSAVYRHG